MQRLETLKIEKTDETRSDLHMSSAILSYPEREVIVPRENKSNLRDMFPLF